MRSGDIASEGTLSPIPLPADFNIAGQVQGDVMYFNGTNWVRLAPGTAGQSLRTLGAAANPAWETVNNATNLSISGETTGDMLYYNGANWVRVGAGTSGQLLQTNGAAAPTWVNAPTSDPPAIGVAFEATGANASLDDGTDWAKVTFSSENFDLGSDFDLGNERFVAPIAGLYHFTWGGRMASASGSTSVSFMFYKNGGEYSGAGNWAKGTTNAGTPTRGTFGGAAFMRLAVNDFVEIWGVAYDGVTNSGGIFSGSKFAGYLVLDET